MLEYRRQKRDSNTHKQKYECEACGFKFSLNPKKFRKIDCPWCGHLQSEGYGKGHGRAAEDHLDTEMGHWDNHQ
jgi:DNA-directed RNA polymerase subunit RPC12/RpoP